MHGRAATSPSDGSPATYIVVTVVSSSSDWTFGLVSVDVVGDDLPDAAGRGDGGGRRCWRRDACHQSRYDGIIGLAGSSAASAPVCRSTWRRMSFIGSTERTRGMTSKLFSGGGDGVNHSSVLRLPRVGPGDRALA